MKFSITKSVKEKRFAQIYTDTFDKLYRIFMSTFADAELVEDALQEAYLKVWLEMDEDDSEREDYEETLYHYARNHIAKEKAKKSRRAILLAQHIQIEPFTDANQDMDNREYRVQLSNVVRRLPVKCQEVYRLHKEEGLSYDSIAEKLMISTKTVDNHLQKAAKTLKKGLQSIYGLTNLTSFILFLFLI